MTVDVQTVAWFACKIVFIVFFFGFCVFIHEFGHLLVALWRGLHVEKFSIGFGKAIYRFRKWDIDFLISWLPFGGYVALPQLEPGSNPRTSDDRPLPVARPIDRILTAFAGPIFNILFGFFLAVIIWKVGIDGPAPATSVTIGHVPESYVDAAGIEQASPEYAAGVRPGDVIISVNGNLLKKGWEEVVERILYSNHGRVTLGMLREGQPVAATYELVPNAAFEGLGYPFMGPLVPTRVGDVFADSPAAMAGLRSGDILLEINGRPVINAELLVAAIQASGGTPISMTVMRDGKEIVIDSITAAAQGEDGKYMIGIKIESVFTALVRNHPTPWKQFTDVITRTYKTLRGLFDKKNPIQAKHMSGPVGIFHILYVIVSNAGFMAALNLIIVVNFSLAILNLFPLPVLDGGHIVLGLLEMIFRRPVPTSITTGLSYTFAMALIGFMLYVTYHDAKRVSRSFYRPPPHTQSEKLSPATPQPDDPEESVPAAGEKVP